MIDTDKYEGVRTPFGIVPTEDILKMLEPIRERDNKIAELDAEVKRLREELRITQSNFSMVRNALANQYPEIEEAIWKVIE